MHKDEKERVVAELAEQLKATDSLIVADYRGLTNSEMAALRTTLRGHGARFAVVKNTLARRAADAAGADALLTLLEGPTAIAFVESGGDPAVVAKALADVADKTKILTLRGGIMSGRSLSDAEVEQLAKLPPVDVLKGQLVGVIVAPLTQLAALVAAPLRDLVGLIDARIAQLDEGGDTSASAAPAAVEEEAPAAAEEADAPAEDAEPAPEAEASAATEEAPAAADEPAPAEEPAAEPEASAAPDDDAAAPADETDTNETDSTEED
jgi:large subunit ribosomal protein L10